MLYRQPNDSPWSMVEHPTATLLEFRLLRWIHIFLLCTMLVEIFWFHRLVIQFVSPSSISEIQDHFDDALSRAMQDAFPRETRVKAWFNKFYNEKSIYFGDTVIVTKSLRLFTGVDCSWNKENIQILLINISLRIKPKRIARTMTKYLSQGRTSLWL